MSKIFLSAILCCLQALSYSQVTKLLYPFIVSDDIDSISEQILAPRLIVLVASDILTITNYSCYSICSVVPVQLLSFDAKRKSDIEVKVKWKTTNEWNNKEFVVQRSIGNSDAFMNVGLVPADYSPAFVHSYTFLDKNDDENISYYRLQQIDIANEFKYSRIIAFKGNPAHESISVYPNPATTVVLLNVWLKKTDKVKIDIYNREGQRLVGQTGYFSKGNNSKQFTIHQYGKGTYFIRIIESEGNILNTKFIKQ